MADISTRTETVLRQWVSVGGSSCDMRVGSEALRLVGPILKGAVGRPRLCLLALEVGVDEALREKLRHALSDAGFELRLAELPSGPAARSLASVSALADQLAAEGITSDDLICAAGGADALSAVSYLAGSWCASTPLALVPTLLDACVECGTTPRGIDVAGKAELISVRPAAKYLIADLDHVDCDPGADASLLARAYMASSALADNEKAVERLWDRAELIAAGDLEALAAQLAECAKTRGHIISSTSIALRQTVGFGQTFMRALATLVDDVAPGRLLAEGLRFQARLAAGMELVSVDDVLTIDELLDLLELEAPSCDVEPAALVRALKDERFSRSGRFLLALPTQVGRVRLSSVEDELLLEHATAWCAAHRP